jgi:hypothetical protein
MPIRGFWSTIYLEAGICLRIGSAWVYASFSQHCSQPDVANRQSSAREAFFREAVMKSVYLLLACLGIGVMGGCDHQPVSPESSLT